MLDENGKRSTYLGGIHETLSASIQPDQTLALQGKLKVGEISLAGGKFGKGLTLSLDKKDCLQSTK